MILVAVWSGLEDYFKHAESGVIIQAGEMAQCLRALATLAENPFSFQPEHQDVHSHL
ncbi:hypothetical protein LEMLEM_LOCUS12433 [Lemmus lemmus]